MSSRAIRRLRQDQLLQQQQQQQQQINEESEQESSEEEDLAHSRPSTHFAMFDSDSSSSSSSSDDDDNNDDDDDIDEEEDAKLTNEDEEEHDKQEEDLDAILNEFEISQKSTTDDHSTKISPTMMMWKKLLQFDSRNLDVEYALRNVLGEGGAVGDNMTHHMSRQRKPTSIFASPNWNANDNANQNNQNNNANRNNRRRNLRQQQQRKIPKPPHFMGGGLGMRIEGILDKGNVQTHDDFEIPFPYNDSSALRHSIAPNKPIHYTPSETSTPSDNNEDDSPYSYQLWYSFHPSTTYQKTLDYFSTLMNQMTSYADANILTLFVADHPFVSLSNYQLSLLFFQTLGQMEKGMELLKRSLCVWEIASSITMTDSDRDWFHEKNKIKQGDFPGLIPGLKKSKNDDMFTSFPVFIDSKDQKEENSCFFMALFRYMQVSSMMGALETSFATARFLLSLDPLRDPMGVLMIMDYYGLATVSNENTRLLVELVESNILSIHHQEDTSQTHHHISHLLDMPNWAFHYALALNRLEKLELDDGEDQVPNSFTTTSNEALRQAIQSHPSIVVLLLQKNNIDIKSRSFRADWPSVLPTLDILSQQMGDIAKGYEKVVSIFIERSYRLWSAEETLTWLYENCSIIVKSHLEHYSKEKNNYADDESNEESDIYPTPILPKGIALDRYYSCNPQDFADRFQMLPGDGNFLDPNLVNLAMEYDPNRRPLLRQQRRNQNNNAENEMDLQRMLLEQLQRDGNGNPMMVDPDTPLAELFLRSMMPWARVQGVPPGRR